MSINVNDLIPTEEKNLFRYDELNEKGEVIGTRYFRYNGGNMVDEPTPIDRKLLMQLQGFEATKTIFNANGSITSIGETGTTLTTFLSNGNIETVFTSNDNKVIGTRTIFNSDGTITTEVM